MNEELKALLEKAIADGIVASVANLHNMTLSDPGPDVYGNAVAAGSYHVLDLRVLVPVTRSSGP